MSSLQTHTATPTITDPVDAVRRGLSVFPLPARGRIPALQGWPDRCTRDLAVIRRYWPTSANIGIGCKASGLLGIDLDRHHKETDGVHAFGQLCKQHGQPWPDTLTVQTPRDGLHLYLWAPTGRPLGNTSGKLAPGVDTRGPGAGSGGGYLVGPGSVVDGGRGYTIVRDAPIVPCPSWIVELLDPPRPHPSRGTVVLPITVGRYVAAALNGEIRRVLDAPEGGRNDALNTSAFVLGTLVGAGRLDQVDAEEALMSAAQACGLVDEDGERRTMATVRSGLAAGIRRPRVEVAR